MKDIITGTLIVGAVLIIGYDFNQYEFIMNSIAGVMLLVGLDVRFDKI